jgi:Zn-dependent peptidase ImmA (M78 family)/DNA-binding XRE family transcriptional regulator
MAEQPRGEMLVLARESRGLTQIELARRIDVSQGTISKAENGLLEPSEELVALYARALSYPPAFFSEIAPPRRLPVTFYRKRSSAGNPALRTVDAQMTILRMRLKILLRSVESEGVELPTVRLKDMGYSPMDLAREIRARWSIQRGPIENLVEALEEHGIFVVLWDFGVPGVDGLSVYERDDVLPPLIVLDPNYSGDRLRWTAAHELGHLLMHHHEPLPGPSYEQEADEFAAEFLMPAAEVGPFLSSVTIDRLANLKRHWRTSMQSLLVRAADLDRISESQRNRLWSAMGALGFRKEEPYRVEVEQPRLVKELIAFHLAELGYAPGDLSAATRMDRDEFDRVFLREHARRLRAIV